MALSMIKQKIDTRAYQSVREFVRDFALVCSNARMFNRPGSSAHHDALLVEGELKGQLEKLVESGAIDGEDSILPDLGEIPDYDYSPDPSDHLESSRSENLLAVDASMRSLREWQKNAKRRLQGPSSTSVPKAGQAPLKDSGLESVARVCDTCRHRFARSANPGERSCPKCGSEFVFTDYPSHTVSNVPAADTARKHEPGPGLHPLGIAPSELLDLIVDIKDATDRLQVLQDRHSKNQRDLPEAVVQLLSLSNNFERLAELQENPDYQDRFQRVQEIVHVLCSSVQYTMATALSSLCSPLDERQWMALCSSMRYIESTDILQRLRWYQAAIMGLLDHLDGFTSESLLGMDSNIQSLLERQKSVKRSGDHITLPKVSGDDQTGLPPEASTSRTGAEPTNPNTSSETSNAAQPHDQTSTSQSLTRLITSTTRAVNILQILQMHHSRDVTIVPEITDDLQSLSTSLQKLSQLYEDPPYEPNFVKVQEPIQVLCRSMQHTLDATLQVLTAEPPSDETILMQLTMLTARMAGEENVGLPERLRWYSASLLGLLNHLDGFPSAGRIFQWLGMNEKVRSLLARQESGRG